MKYVMLILNTEESAKLSEADMQAWTSEIMAWYEKQGSSGKMPDGGAQLESPDTAKTIRAGGVTDGPFIETKEFIAGIDVVRCADRQQAIELAAAHPIARYHAIEVRPFYSE